MNTLRKRTVLTLSIIVALLIMVGFDSAPVSAQQINGVPGSANATVTLDGKQLPPPPMPFGGVIKESVTESKPWWPRALCRPRARPTSFSS